MSTPLDQPARAVIVAMGLVLLWGFVWVGAALRPGEVQCVVCHGGLCTGSTDCPGTYVGIVVVLVLLAVAASIIAMGLSPMTLDFFTTKGYASLRRRGLQVRRRLGVEFLAPFLTFFGWALMAWGLLVPWNFFALCEEPCSFPYVLEGIPLGLVCAGAIVLGLGVVLLLILSRAHRAEREENRGFGVANPPTT